MYDRLVRVIHIRASLGEACIQDMKSRLASAPDEYAAFIFEPLIQGAGGMVMYEPEVLDKLVSLAKQHQVITIADEIMKRSSNFYIVSIFFAYIFNTF